MARLVWALLAGVSEATTFQFGLERDFGVGIGLDAFFDAPQLGFQSSQFLDIENEVQHERGPPGEHGRLKVGAGGLGEQFQFGQNEQVVEEPVAEEADADSERQNQVGSVETSGRVFQ